MKKLRMKKLSVIVTTVFLASFPLTAWGLDASTQVGQFSGNHDPDTGKRLKTLFQDSLWGIGDIFTEGTVVTTVGKVETIGQGQDTPPLNPTDNFTSDEVIVKDFAIEAVLQATVDTVVTVDGVTTTTFKDVKLSLYFGDDIDNDSLDDTETLADALGDDEAPGGTGSDVGEFDDNVLVAEFMLDGGDDFYRIISEGGVPDRFELALTNTFRDPTQIGPFVSTAIEVPDGLGGTIEIATADILGTGTVLKDTFSGAPITTDEGFVKLNGNFAAVIVPTPTAAMAGLLCFGLVALRKPRRDAA